MSCGKAHETACTQVIESLVLYVDQETCVMSEELIRVHLEQCITCCAERDLQVMMKGLIARSCCPEPVSDEFRLRINTIITEIQIEITQD